jgi:hypothetical protein
MRIWTTLLAGGLLWAAGWGQAQAAELAKTTVAEDGPRVTLQLRFDTAVEYHPIYNYAKNLLVVQVDGLKLTRQQLRNGPAVHDARLAPFIASGSFEQSKDSGDLRLQLTKGVTPADALLIQRDKGLDIQFVAPETSAPHKPASGKAAKPGPQAAKPAKPAAPAPAPEAQPGGDTADGAPGGQPGDSGWQPPAGDDAPMTSLTGQTYSDPPVKIAGAGDTDDAAPADSSAGQPPADPQPADAGFIPDQTPAAAAPADGGDPAHDLQAANKLAPAKPGGSPSGAPSYKNFDLGQVPVKQLEIKGLPFREALSQLVAGCGFNVVVGKDIDNEPVYLNFTQKSLSLKSALETLCMAYELAYSVQDDAIVITKQ